MTNINTCRFCQHYAPEGRRGGHCTKLQVEVSADWEACPLAEHPFADQWNDPIPLLADVRSFSHGVGQYHSDQDWETASLG